MSATNLVTGLIGGAVVLAIVFFLVRPELWARLWWTRVDPRPAALLRIGFGLVVLWTFVGFAWHARVFWSDEGMWLPDMAREEFGGTLSHLWDPVHGFERWWSPLLMPYGKLTILHYGSPPWLVFVLYGGALASLALMIVGLWTRWSTILAWVLLLQLYRYQPMYFSGGDRVIQDFLFLGMLSRWGEAYSLDGWRRRERRPASERRIPAWPLRLMMLQLALIYCATGLFKTGPAWAQGEALYYAMNLDHFYRVPATGLVTRLQQLGVLPWLTHLVRWWEVLFPLVLLGAAVRAWDAERRAGCWPATAALRRWTSWLIAGLAWSCIAGAVGVLGGHPVVALLLAISPLAAVLVHGLLRRRPGLPELFLRWGLGKRSWLTFGVLLHLGIDLGVNVGTFANVMIPLYFAWLSGPELDALWRSLGWRPGRGGNLAVDTRLRTRE